MSAEDLVVAITTVADPASAQQLAQVVIDQGVAACAQIDGPIESHYLWQGQKCVEQEWRLIIKTTVAASGRLRDLVLASHPYDEPQWIVLPVVEASEGYGNWVRVATGVAASTDGAAPA